MITPFESELADSIRAKIKSLRKDGTVGMSLDNLRMVTPSPKATQGAPCGGNVRWQYAQIFNRVARSAAGRFLIS